MILIYETYDSISSDNAFTMLDTNKIHKLNWSVKFRPQ